MSLTWRVQIKNKTSQIEVNWKPKIYSKLSIVQDITAQKLLSILKINEKDIILDVGCGDGKITAQLSNIAKNGSVLGIDKSLNMIDFAVNTYCEQQYPNLNFQIKSAENIRYNESYDLIFSSFALQWFKDKNSFFVKAHKSLRSDGKIAIVAPVGVSPELEQAIQVVINSPEWFSYYKNFHPGWYFSSPKFITHLVKENCFNITYSSTYVQEVRFQSLDEFEKYILLWFPYLKPLKETQRKVFFSEVINEYCKILPINLDDSVIMRVPIISLVASKPNL